MTTLRVTNATRNSVLATRARVAKDATSRKLGLIGFIHLEPGDGLYIPECNTIHTVEMKFAIDVVFVETMTGAILKVAQRAQPGCHFNTLIPSEVCAVLKLPEGTIELTGSAPGDVLVFMSSGHGSQEELNRIGAL